jgi:hypothetical protein
MINSSRNFLINTLNKLFLFNLAQFSLITDNPKQLVLKKKHSRYLHLECYMPKTEFV